MLARLLAERNARAEEYAASQTRLMAADFSYRLACVDPDNQAELTAAGAAAAAVSKKRSAPDAAPPVSAAAAAAPAKAPPTQFECPGNLETGKACTTPNEPPYKSQVLFEKKRRWVCNVCAKAIRTTRTAAKKKAKAVAATTKNDNEQEEERVVPVAGGDDEDDE